MFNECGYIVFVLLLAPYTESAMEAAAAEGGAEEQEFPIFVRRRSNEAYSVMNFRCTEDVVFAEWREARMRRQDNSHSQERGPGRVATGAGTEGGRRPGAAPRDQATYRPEEQPWLLRVDGRRRRTFRGRREGGVADHSAYYVFAMQTDGTIEATPVGQWHTFEPLHTYKTLSIEEAEQLYKNRDKKLDYFAVMIQKRLNDAKLEAGEEENDGAGEGAGAGAGSGSASCEAGEAEDRDGRSGESSGDEDDGAKKKSQREQSRAKMNRLYSGESDDEQIAEMDDDDDSSDSLEADDDEADTQDQKDGEENAEENKETEEANGKDATGEEDKEPEEGEITENKRPEGGIEEGVAVATELEATVPSAGAGRSDDDGGGRGGAKNGSERHRRRLGAGAGGDWRAPRAPLPPELVALEEVARRHLLRRPVTVQQLLRRLKPHRRGLPAERVVDAMARVLRAINPRRRLVHGKMYLFVD